MAINPITIDTLEIIDAIERRGSFAKAAEELNKVPSALSYSVQKLEEQLGITLFQRQGRRSVLTPAGQFILEEGRKILRATIELKDKAKEVATGWEPKLRIALESVLDYSKFFTVLAEFLEEQPGLEVDIRESILNGGWEALEKNHVDLIVGAPGPVPLQKGYRAIPFWQSELVMVIASHHPQAKKATQTKQLKALLPNLRRIITHDTSAENIERNAGLSLTGNKLLYVQTIDQKVEAITAGLGVGFLPQHRIQHLLNNKTLLPINLPSDDHENFMAWKISNKGKALNALTKRLMDKT
jgi:DNA-binding transcriptional LysR family regulator